MNILFGSRADRKKQHRKSTLGYYRSFASSAASITENKDEQDKQDNCSQSSFSAADDSKPKAQQNVRPASSYLLLKKVQPLKQVRNDKTFEYSSLSSRAPLPSGRFKSSGESSLSKQEARRKESSKKSSLDNKQIGIRSEKGTTSQSQSKRSLSRRQSAVQISSFGASYRAKSIRQQSRTRLEAASSRGKASELRAMTNKSKRSVGESARKKAQQSIVAVTENRSREVGLAVFNTVSGQFFVTQYSQSPDYIKTMSLLNRVLPLEVIAPNTLQSQILTKTAVRPIPRAYFDESKGFSLFEGRANRSECLNPDSKYLAWSALSGLVAFLQNDTGYQFREQALKIEFQHMDEVMIIERRCIRDLEIFLNKIDNSPEHSFFANFQCLTPGGRRLLRSQILQPLVSREAILKRQLAVEGLIQDRDKLLKIRKLLPKFTKFDLVTAKLTQKPAHVKARLFQFYLSHFVTFIQIVRAIPQLPLVAPDLTVRMQALQALCRTLESSLQPQLLAKLSNQAGLDKNKSKLLYLIKNSANEYLQLARLTYSFTAAQVKRVFQGLRAKIPQLSLQEHRGVFLLGLPESYDRAKAEMLLGDEMIDTRVRNKRLHFVVSVIDSLNHRLQESAKEIIEQSEKVVLRLIDSMQDKADDIFGASLAVSTTDMLAALATLAIKMNYSKPSLLPSPELRSHSVSLTGERPVSLHSSRSERVQLLREIGLSVVLTQIGSFVPLKDFETGLFHLMLSKFQIRDNLQFNLSHFQGEILAANELLEAAGHCQGSCFVLLNDLITGTQYHEQLAFSFSLLENLQRRGALTLAFVADQRLLAEWGGFQPREEDDEQIELEGSLGKYYNECRHLLRRG